MNFQRLKLDSIFDSSEDCFLIAEVAQAHDGSLGMAHAFIDAVAKTGADAIKFQTHIADAESSSEDQWRAKFSYEDKTRYDYWKRMEFTVEQWAGLKHHCDEKGLIFLSSAFSLQAVELLQKLEMPAWKIASGEINNFLMVDNIIETNSPILLSSGMSDWDELDQCVGRIQQHENKVAIMQCTTSYPCPPEKVGLNILNELRNRYSIPVGLSDHSATIFPSLAAASLGAKVIEVHITLSPDMFGPDVKSSLTVEEMTTLSQGLRQIATMRANPIDKSEQAKGLVEMKGLFNQGLVLSCDLEPGTPLKKEHLSTRKPVVGIPASDYESVLGQQLNTPLKAGDFLRSEHLNP